MFEHLDHLELLKKQHKEWDRLLKKQEERPILDAQLIQDYKKHKLKIKEEIQKLEEKLFK